MEQEQHKTIQEERHTFTGWFKVLRARKAKRIREALDKLSKRSRTLKIDEDASA